MRTKASPPRRRGPNAWCAALVAALAIVVPAQARNEPARGFRYQLVTGGDDSALVRRIVDDLVPRLVPIFAGFRTELAQRHRMLYVAIGPAALRDVAAQRCDCVVISAFTSSQVFHAIVDALPPARAAAITAVYAEPAPGDQLRLARLLYRRPLRMAAIVGPGTGFLAPQLAESGVVVLDARRDGESVDDINGLLNRIGQLDALLALPDSAIYNTDNFRNILLSTYRHKQGVIGFSGDMVKAGALATTYSGIEDIGAQIEDIASAYVAGGELPAPAFPRYFRTAVNEGVARSLDIEVSDAVRRFARRPPARRSGAAP